MSLSMHPFEQTVAPPTAAQLWTPIRTWFASPNSRIAAGSRLLEVKANLVRPDGKYANQSRTERHAPPLADCPSGAALVHVWPQLTLAISLRTANQRGPGSFGRFYPPTTAVAAQGNGRISSAELTQIADSAQVLINSLNAVKPPWAVVVASAVDATATRVTKVLVGNVMDTQRRRRESIPETYISRDIPTTAGGSAVPQ